MGEAFLDRDQKLLVIYSDIILYGSSASPELAQQVASDIESAWNEACATAAIGNTHCEIRFAIKGIHKPGITPEEVWYNDDPRKNYFRVEPFAEGNISFVDGIGSNTGYFLLDNLLNQSTTAAHEYGHTLGLVHPADIDFRGKGQPGIMYPRGTLVDPEYQYDPLAVAGMPGGTLHPRHRKVLASDVALLKPEQWLFRDNKAVAGTFTSIYHEAQVPPVANVHLA